MVGVNKNIWSDIFINLEQKKIKKYGCKEKNNKESYKSKSSDKESGEESSEGESCY